MKFKQLQISYDREQDRLLLRLNTNTENEFHFWLTRLLVKRLWPLLNAGLETHPHIQQQAGAARETVKSFKRESALSKSDFTSPYQEPEQDEEVSEITATLVHTAQVKALGKGSIQLGMHPKSGSGIEITLNHQMLHAVCQLLNQGVEKADWGLNLSDAPSDSTTTTQQTTIN